MDNLALEGNFMMGAGSGSYSTATNVSQKISNGYGIALRPFVNITDDLEVFGRIGKSRTKVDWQATGESGSETVTSTVYGVGLAYKLSNEVRLVLDYSKTPEKNETNTSIVGVGVRYNF